VALLSVAAASCTTGGETSFEMGNPTFGPSVAGVMADAAAEASTPAFTGGTAAPTGATGEASLPSGGVVAVAGVPVPESIASAEPSMPEPATVGTVMDENDSPLPEQVAYLPAANPAFPAALVEASAAAPQAAAAPPAADPAAPAASAAASVPVPLPSPAAAAPAEQKFENPVYVTATDPAAPIAAAPQKRSFLSSLFGSSPSQPAAQPKKAAPLVTLASAQPAKPIVTASLASNGGSADALPGVRKTALFEITRKSGLDDDSDVDLHEDEDGGPIQLASASGLARLAPNGLLTQTEKVDVACLKPSLVRVLKTIEQHYNRKIVVTSGYRSPSHNRRARGAKNSLHMYCAAADVQVQGISKWELASFVRAMPGRGGVGTYCHTESVHVDVGPERDWNWRCRRRKG
jgi:uncharacterized protein YcbK (DUF882 family)